MIRSRKTSLTGIASVSFLIALFDRLGEIIYNAFVGGFFGRIFSSYKKLQSSFEGSFLKEFIFGDRRFKKFFRSLRKFLSSNIEDCFIVTRGQRMIHFFSSAPLNYYGNFLSFFGVYTCVVYFVRLLVSGISSASSDYLFIGIGAIIISLPLLFSRISMASALQKSVIGRMLIEATFGISDETIKKHSAVRKGKGNVMLFLGLVAGILTFFIHPLTIILAILFFVLVCFIAVSPEIGVLITIFVLPFCSFMSNPTIALCGIVLLTAFFYVIKLIRGKRVFKLELVDAAVLLFALMIYFSSVFSAGGEGSRNAALVSCALMLGYFLLVNLMRTEKWIKRCVFALVSSGSIVAMIGVLEYFFGKSSSQWLDVRLFTNIRVRVVSLFDNPNVLATYLVLIFPFALNFFILAKKRNEKFLSAIVCAAFVVATVFTWSRGAWIAMVLTFFVFFTVYTRKTLRIFGAAILAAPVLPMILPDNLLDRAFSILNFSDSSISYRIYTWIGSLRVVGDHFLGGIGFGPEAFAKIYPAYAFAGIESAEHSHSLPLQILIGMGIGGLLVFVALIFLYLQKTLEYVRKPESSSSKFYVTAAVASVIGALVMGAFDYIWYNYRVFYIFWIVIALGCALVRAGNYEADRNVGTSESYGHAERDEQA
ncbi:MAG: O-antigen ligase family protein [Clostridia bacterium]|nr:O-antigen ligase family protein [Clostridia bacterium]